MTTASGAPHRMPYVAETTWGPTPAPPTLSAIRHNSATLALQRGTLQSEEIRDDRMLVDFRLGQRSVAGDIVGELSDGSYDDFLQAALGGTWAADVLKAGVVRRSFTVERYFADITRYVRYRGCEVNTLALTVSPEAICGITFGMMGKDQDATASTAIAGSTYPAAPTSSPYDGFSGAINEGGSAIAIVTEVSINLNNNLQANPVIGSISGLQATIGRSLITGSLSAYFEDEVMLNKFINETSSSLSFTLGGSGSGMTLLLPKIKYTGGQPDTSGEGSIILQMPFQALYDSTEATNIKITRNV